MTNGKEWVDYILAALFQADDRRLDETVKSLNTQNGEIKKQNFHGFIHHGKRFIDLRYKKIQHHLAKQPLPTLSLQLMSQLKLFDADRTRIDNDKSRVRQALVPLIVNCVDMQDLRDSVPDCVAMLVNELKSLPRMRESVTTHIKSDPYAMKAYEKALPLMEQYSVAALIY